MSTTQTTPHRKEKTVYRTVLFLDGDRKSEEDCTVNVKPGTNLDLKLRCNVTGEKRLQLEGQMSFLHLLTSTNCKIHIFAHNEFF